MIEEIKEMQALTKALHDELFVSFKALTLHEKIELYCQASEGSVAELFDSFLKTTIYYTGGSLDLYDLYWERHETMSISDVFDFLLDAADDDTLFDPKALVEYVKNGDSTAHKVFRDFLDKNIGKATYDW